MFSSIYYDAKANKIHLWEFINGQKTYGEYDYVSYCYIYDNNGEYTDLTGKKCKRKEFNNWFDQRNFLEKCETLEGDVNPEDRFLIDRYAHIKEFTEVPTLDIHFIDIETETENGFPDIENPRNEINLLTVYSTQTKKFHMFGLKDYIPESKNVEFNYCETEEELLKKYFRWHKDYYPSVLSGWNIRGFDIPYIINRARYLLSESVVKKYSPIGVIREIQVRADKGQNYKSYSIAGINILDYMDLYKTFSINERESYSLNYISQVELNKEKVKYDGSLNDLWKEDWNKFCRYNLQDVQLLLDLEAKLGYLKLVQAQSYMCRCSFEKYGSTLKKHDNYLLSTLKEKKIVLPTTKHSSAMEIPGGYVSEPKVGYYKNVVSYDFTSLYPHIIMAMNISPERLVGKIKGNFTDFDLEKINVTETYEVAGKKVTGERLKEFINQNNLILTPNGVLFRPEEGFIPKVIKHIYAKRKEYKNKMQAAEKLYQQTKDEKYNIEKSTYDSFQYSTKILANSLFGALANAHFRLFNIDFASAITLTGQKVVQFTGTKIDDFFDEKFKINNVSIYSDTDSVVGDSIIKTNHGDIKIEDIFNVFEGDVKEYQEGKYIKEIKNLTSLSLNVNTKLVEEKNIKYVMKHKVKKNMYKISYHDKIVILTEDHSLIILRQDELLEISPNNLQKGDKIIIL